jgi:hypothetical protein
MNLRRWTQCSSDRKRKLSNEELMQTHEEFALATGGSEKDCCNKEELVSDWIQTFYCEAIIKIKEDPLTFKKMSPSNVLFNNEFNSEHNPALFVLTLRLLTVQNVQVWNFLQQFSPLYTNKLTNFSICPLQSH